MSVLDQLYPRVYAHSEPPPCPDHGRLSLRGVTWYCDWEKREKRFDKYGMPYNFTTRCTYRPGRTEAEVIPNTDDFAEDWESLEKHG